MLTKKMEDALCEQLNWELFSAYLYVAMAAYANSLGLSGFTNWFNIQVKEELAHAEKFFNYIIQQDGKVTLKPIKKPESDFSSANGLFKTTVEHEKLVTKRIHGLVDVARKEKDHATETFLGWFVTEQVEEVASASEVLQKLNLIGKDGNGLLVIDGRLAARVFTPPAAAA